MLSTTAWERFDQVTSLARLLFDAPLPCGLTTLQVFVLIRSFFYLVLCMSYHHYL